MKRTVFIVMVGVTFAYLIIGALVFHFMEGSNETKAKRNFAMDHEIFLSNHTCVTPELLHEYVLRVIETHGEGVAVARITGKNTTGNVTIEKEIEDTGTKWDVASSILFCITVISTIGYGNMSPKTWNGQLFCIFYALIGIPMFATVLVGTGERLQIPIKMVHRGTPWVKDNPSRDEKIKSIVLLSIGTFFVTFLPSLVFHVTQDWSYLESIYYTVITLTTIGFGDLVPGYFEKPVEGSTKTAYIYRIILGLWILFGLSWGALILSEIGSLLTKKITTATSQTQQRLSNLEDMVKEKAKVARDKLIKKDGDNEYSPAKNGKEIPDAEPALHTRRRVPQAWVKPDTPTVASKFTLTSSSELGMPDTVQTEDAQDIKCTSYQKY